MSRSRGLANASRIAFGVISWNTIRRTGTRGFKRLEHVPTNRLALAILVGREDQFVGALERRFQLGDDLLLVGRDDVTGVEMIVGIDAGEPSVRDLLVVGDLFLAAREVSDVPDARLDRVVAPEESRDGLGLRRGLHDDERFCHCYSLARRRRRVASFSALGSRTVARPPEPDATPNPMCALSGRRTTLRNRLFFAAVMTAVNWLSAKDLIETFGTIGLIAIVFIESGLLPVPLPGDSILVLAGAFCATNKPGDPHLNLAVVVIGTLVAAIAGAEIGFALGRRYGTRLFKPDAHIFKTDYLERAQEFFDRRGPRAVVIARFVPVVRTIVPMLAGAGNMPQRKFALANVIGAVLWTVGISMLGYVVGRSISIDKYILPIVAVIIVLSLIPPFLEYRRHKRADPSPG